MSALTPQSLHPFDLYVRAPGLGLGLPLEVVCAGVCREIFRPYEQLAGRSQDPTLMSERAIRFAGRKPCRRRQKDESEDEHRQHIVLPASTPVRPEKDFPENSQKAVRPRISTRGAPAAAASASGRGTVVRRIRLPGLNYNCTPAPDATICPSRI